MNIIDILKVGKITVGGEDYIATSIETRNEYNDGKLIINILAEKVAQVQEITIKQSENSVTALPVNKDCLK